MVIFRVIQNINIKGSDGTLVAYKKVKNPSNLLSESLYITTYEDFENLKGVFLKVGKEYQTKTLAELNIRKLEYFPKELGIENKDELSTIVKGKKELEKKGGNYRNNFDLISLYLGKDFSILEDQIKNSVKQNIKIAILGNVGFNIGEMIASVSAIRILYEELSKKFKQVTIELFLNFSNNGQFVRDKEIFSNQSFIHKVSALSISVKKLCNEYDYFIDASLVTKQPYYNELSYIDAWLYKFGIDFNKIDKSRKYNTLDLNKYKPSKALIKKLEEVRLKGKPILFHPYSKDVKRSIPKEIASKMLKELLLDLNDYVVISVLNIEGIKDDAYIDLSKYSKDVLDFSFIISNMCKVITVDTSTYHISDAFFIPTVAIFTNENPLKRIKNYNYVKAIIVDDKSKNLSLFTFDNNSLVIDKFRSWYSLKIKKIIKLLN